MSAEEAQHICKLTGHAWQAGEGEDGACECCATYVCALDLKGALYVCALDLKGALYAPRVHLLAMPCACLRHSMVGGLKGMAQWQHHPLHPSHAPIARLGTRLDRQSNHC